MSILPITLISTAVAFLAYYPTRFLAFRLNVIDHPSSKRKIHQKPIPRMGGLAMYSAMMLCTYVLYTLGLIQSVAGLDWSIFAFFATFAFLIGFVDDVFTIGSKRKLAAQMLLSLMLYKAGFRLEELYLGPGWTVSLGFFSPIVTTLWIVGVMNAINLIDGMDGLAAGVSTISFALVAAFSAFYGDQNMFAFSAVMVGACLGFLFFNFNPAKIFMGDCGSLFLGFTLSLASTSVTSTNTHVTPFYLSLLVLMFPILDTFVAIVRRVLRTLQNKSDITTKSTSVMLTAIKKVLEADGDHIHHRLLKKSLSQKQVALILYTFSLCCGLVGFLMLHLPTVFSWILGLTTIYSIYHLVLSLDYLEFAPKELRLQKQMLEENHLLNPRAKMVKKAS